MPYQYRSRVRNRSRPVDPRHNLHPKPQKRRSHLHQQPRPGIHRLRQPILFLLAQLPSRRLPLRKRHPGQLPLQSEIQSMGAATLCQYRIDSDQCGHSRGCL